MTSAISLSNVNLITIDNHYILKNINLNINKGDCVTIFGHNGAGKTSLLKIINNLIKPSGGYIKIFNKEITNKLKKSIGYIPQTNKFNDNIPITVKQAIGIGITAKRGLFFNSRYKEDYLLIEEISKQLNIYHLLNVPIGKLSGGEMQKVSIARVLAQEAEIILLDEPLINLDTKSQKDFIKIIDDIHNKNFPTILIVIHNLKQIPKCCNKIITMENGEAKLKDYNFKNLEDFNNN